MITPQQILYITCDELALEKDEVCTQCRVPLLVIARSVIAYVARDLTRATFPQIAQMLGRNGHSSIYRAWKNTDTRVKAGDMIQIHSVIRQDLYLTTWDELVERVSDRVQALEGQSNPVKEAVL